MNKRSVPLSILAFCIATSSYAQITSNGSIEADVSEQCGHYYRSVLNQPVTTRKTAVTIDKEAAEAIQRQRQLADEYIMTHDIADLPTTVSPAKGGGKPGAEILYTQGGFITQRDAVDILMSLSGHYFLGEYVPKDDHQAIVYLEKLVSYYQQNYPETAEQVIMSMMYSLIGGASEDNPMWGIDGPNQIFKLLIEAGSIETEAMLIAESLDASDIDCISTFLPKLEDLANQGSRIAIHELVETYQNLNYQNPSKFIDEVNYWRMKSLEYPKAKFDSGF